MHVIALAQACTCNMAVLLPYAGISKDFKSLKCLQGTNMKVQGVVGGTM